MSPYWDCYLSAVWHCMVPVGCHSKHRSTASPFDRLFPQYRYHQHQRGGLRRRQVVSLYQAGPGLGPGPCARIYVIFLALFVLGAFPPTHARTHTDMTLERANTHRHADAPNTTIAEPLAGMWCAKAPKLVTPPNGNPAKPPIEKEDPPKSEHIFPSSPRLICRRLGMCVCVCVFV